MNEVLVANVYCFGKQKRTFCYRIDDNQGDNIGSFVKVEFNKKELYGIILSIEKTQVLCGKITVNSETFSVEKLKNIKEILYKHLLSYNFLQFLQKMAWYNIIDIERLLENVIPSCWVNKKRELKLLNTKKNSKNKIKIIQLNEEQLQIANTIKVNHFHVSLLRGVMGSGKTYIFMEIVRKKIFENNNNQVLIMVPEIALTNNLIDVIYNFTGIKPVIWHSSVSLAKKKIYFENIINGNIKIIISTRSGLLLPYKNLSLIIIDEEHDSSYKQDETPCYHARDMVILRAKYEDIPVVLSSATPSIETLKNVIDKKYELYTINTQYFHNKHPEIKIVDMNKS